MGGQTWRCRWFPGWRGGPGGRLDRDPDLPSLSFPAQMAAPALLAGGNTGTGVASLSLICEGTEEGVVKRKGGVGEAALTCGGAGGPTASRKTRTGSQSGAWMTRTKRWAPSMPRGPSCLSRYWRRRREGRHGRAAGPAPAGASHSHPFILCLLLPHRVP